MIDFTDCPIGYRDYGGTDTKKSILFGGVPYLLKLPSVKVPANDFQTSHVNNAFSEYLGSHVFETLGLPVHETFLGLYDGVPAVACRDFKPAGVMLQEFSWMMRSFYPATEIGRFPTYRQLYEVMENHELLREISGEAIERYWDTFVGDALIGNFDRHKGNFAYFVDERERKVTLAPIYDCGSCLYPELTMEAMEVVLSNEEEIRKRMFDFPKAMLNMADDIKKPVKLSYFEGLSSGFEANFVKSFVRIYPRIDMVRIYSVVDDAPLIPPEKKRFYKEMLRHRKEMILDAAFASLREKGLA